MATAGAVTEILQNPLNMVSRPVMLGRIACIYSAAEHGISIASTNGTAMTSAV